jgi:hypothetical protein
MLAYILLCSACDLLKLKISIFVVLCVYILDIITALLRRGFALFADEKI